VSSGTSPTLFLVIKWWGLLARIITGGVWIVAGGIKLLDPAASVRAVRAYQLLPEAIVPAVGYALPAIEVAVGLMLVLGIFTRAAAIASSILFALFIAGIISVWMRGISIDCGCFGGGGAKEDAFKDYPWEIARDLGLFALSAWLVWMPRTALAIDNLLSTPHHTSEEMLHGQR
jgi:uncharacterized membrane protein YphA (DoxX/SURF4 family)